MKMTSAILAAGLATSLAVTLHAQVKELSVPRLMK